MGLEVHMRIRKNEMEPDIRLGLANLDLIFLTEIRNCS